MVHKKNLYKRNIYIIDTYNMSCLEFFNKSFNALTQ